MSDRSQYRDQVDVKDARPMTTRAYEAIRDLLVRGRIGEGMPLVEADLARQLGMSKTPIREALLGLAREGLVELSGSRGARVVSYSSADAIDIFQLRSVLEPFAVRLSFPLMTDDDYARLDDLLERAAHADADRDWVLLARLNREFHAGLYATCPNRRVMSTLGQLAQIVQLISIRGWTSYPTHTEELAEHTEILDALRRGKDPDRGCELLTDHIVKFIDSHEVHARED